MSAQYITSTDSELTLALKEGVKDAFDQIYQRHWKRVLNETNKRLKDREQSEELVQDVFTDLWEKRTQKDIQNLYAYLLSSARYRVYMLYRKQQTSPFFEMPLEILAMSHLRADSLLMEKDLKSCIEYWQNMQPEKRAEIFRLRHMEEYSTKEISEMLGISQKTVQNQLITCLASLKAFLSKFMILMHFV